MDRCGSRGGAPNRFPVTDLQHRDVPSQLDHDVNLSSHPDSKLLFLGINPSDCLVDGPFSWDLGATYSNQLPPSYQPTKQHQEATSAPEVPGLSAWLSSLKLAHCHSAAQRWCQQLLGANFCGPMGPAGFAGIIIEMPRTTGFRAYCGLIIV